MLSTLSRRFSGAKVFSRHVNAAVGCSGAKRCASSIGSRPKDTVKSALKASGALASESTPELSAIVDLRQGEKVQQTFSGAEMERRLSMIRNHMTEENIEACVFTSAHHVKYFSDFLYFAFGRNYALVVTQEESISVSAAVDGGQPWRQTYGNNLTYTDWQRGNFFRALQALVGDAKDKRVGFEFDVITMEQMTNIKVFMPSIEMVNVSVPATRMRMIKSPEEIQVIRDGAAIAEIGGYKCLEVMAEGIAEWEVVQAATNVMSKCIAQKYPHPPVLDTWSWFQTGINSDGAHNPPMTKKLESGDIISMNCFPMVSGYFTALERTLFLNHCSDAHLKYWEDNVSVHRRGLELIRPGVRCRDVADELNDMNRSLGLLRFKSIGYGHSLGLLPSYQGREPELEFREDIETVLRPGMVVSMEPMITVPAHLDGAGGYREHDLLVLTENGCENLTATFPIGPEQNIIVK